MSPSTVTFYTLIVSVFLFALTNQTLGSWGLGPLGALLGAYRLQRRPGDKTGKVARGALGWSLPFVLVVFGLRAAAALSGAVIYLSVPYLGWEYEVINFFRAAGVFAWGALGALAVWWGAGPWVRAFYSAALGIWAATWAKNRSERVWMALLAQLGLGLASALVWLCAQSTAALTALVYYDVWRYRTTGQYGFPSFSLTEGRAAIITAIVIMLGTGCYLVGQAALSGVYLRLAKRRLSARQPSEDFSPQEAPDSGMQVEHSPAHRVDSPGQTFGDSGAGSQP